MAISLPTTSQAARHICTGSKESTDTYAEDPNAASVQMSYLLPRYWVIPQASGRCKGRETACPTREEIQFISTAPDASLLQPPIPPPHQPTLPFCYA